MLIALHKNARTKPAVRAEIAASNETASVLAQRFGITEQTVYKWKNREVFGDRSHTAHHLQTVLTPAQETVVVHVDFHATVTHHFHLDLTHPGS
ncbi:hypothetical protein ASF11_07750 [Acidovorax sp. Leaf76]|nr:hypothetical protein ASF11_07750 [Acidovorax sp. Leaf76]KQS31747.1 hypothetical protein ASG27_06870 [Acidovorax sp. Leaf191]